jgi:hypothetical protein
VVFRIGLGGRPVSGRDRPAEAARPAETIVSTSTQVFEDGQSVPALVERCDAPVRCQVGQVVVFEPAL